MLHKKISCGYWLEPPLCRSGQIVDLDKTTGVKKLVSLQKLTRSQFFTYVPKGERSGSVVECRTPEREVRGSRPTSAVLCPWARHFTPRKYWLITQEAMGPSRHDWKIVDWDVKPQHNQPKLLLKEQSDQGLHSCFQKNRWGYLMIIEG